MATLRRLAVLILALAALCATLLAQGSFYLKNDDRVVFYGDSITDQMLYGQFVETYVLTRFPKLKVDYVQSGWGGDRVTGGGGGTIDVRLKRDVIAYKPTVLTVMLGMNDGSYRAFDPRIFETFARGYSHIAQTVRAALPGIRMTLIQPSPYDDVTRPPSFEGGYNAVLVRYGQFVKEFATQGRNFGLTTADLNSGVVAALEKAKAADPELAQKIIPDRVHPARAGHLLMAEGILKAWNAPATVTAVEIDAAAKSVAKAENTSVLELRAESGLSWVQEDKALPMPLDAKDPALNLAVRSSDFMEALNLQTLKVTGLQAARLNLTIDGEQVGSFTKEQLAEGVNLATLPTPMAKQAARVHVLTIKHNAIHEVRWRMVQMPLETENPPRLQAAMDSLDNLNADIVDIQRAAAQPKPHRYELIPE
jgi:lysophospholipase L1-like esterase